MKKDVNGYNETKLEELPTLEVVYKSKNSVHHKDYGNYEMSDNEIANIQKTQASFIPDILKFKVGAQVMLMYNLNLSLNLANGSRGVVTHLDNEEVRVLFKDGIEVDVGKHDYVYENKSVKIIHSQIPLVLAWATTIHKCQGCTMDNVAIDIGDNIFEPGMAYVALSRVRSFSSLYIINLNETKLKPNKDALRYYYDPRIPLLKKCIKKKFFM